MSNTALGAMKSLEFAGKEHESSVVIMLNIFGKQLKYHGKSNQ